MGHRSKSAVRCESCRMHLEVCICEEMPHFDLSTKLCLVMHCREQKKPTATGPMALSILRNSELYVHGQKDESLDLAHLFGEGRRVLVLFPDEGATSLAELDREHDARAISLVVPDGNWRQASRVPRRVSPLQRAETVTLPQGSATEWGIRRETREGGLATFEAIARAYGFLEGASVQRAMERYFRRAVETTRIMRGELKPRHVEGLSPRLGERVSASEEGG